MFKFMLYGLLFLNTALYAAAAPEQNTEHQNAAPEQNGTSSADEIKLNPNGSAPLANPPQNQSINCDYKIPPDIIKVDEAVLLKWSEQAAVQSFTFDFKSTDQQLAMLKTCFTDQGWQSFNEALQKSDNLNAIKTRELMVSSIVDGAATASSIKDNQWKVSVPLQVVYQNSQQKITQRLNIDLIVGRKVSGDLGIMQMIASPVSSNAATGTQTP